MGDYEKICSFENLYKAHCRSRLGKQDKNEVVRFEMNLARNLIRLSEELESRNFKMKGYYSFEIFEPKRRIIYASHYPDRVVQHCLCDEVLIPRLQPRLIYDNAACQPGKGTHFAMKRLCRFMNTFYKRHGTNGYILKCDVRKYFNSIDHNILKRQLGRVFYEKDVLNLLYGIIDSYGESENPTRGLPLGNQSSQWFAIYYLDPLDRLIKEKLKIKYYIRYMDDLILIHEDKDYLRQCLEQVRAFAEEKLHLSFNSKTQIFPLKNGVNFLGFHFYLIETGKVIKIIRRESKIRLKRHLKYLMKQYAAGEVECEKIQNILASYRGHYDYGNCYRLWQKRMSEFTLVKGTMTQQES